MTEHNLHNAVRVNDLEVERDRLVEQLRDMEKIRTRITQLETIIKTWKDVIEEEQPENSQEKLFPTLSEVDSGISLNEVTHLKGICIILKESGHPLTITEIECEFRKRNWKLSEQNGSAILRRILLTRIDLFTKRRADKGIAMYYSLKKD